MENRTYNIGASEVAGLLKEYAGNLLKEKVIGEETHDKLVSMPNYLDTAYSINKKLKFTATSGNLQPSICFVFLV